MNSGEAERLWKLQTSASSLVLEGKRDADSLIQFLQKFVFGSDFGADLWRETYKALGMEDEYRQASRTLFLPDDRILWYVPVAQGVTSNKIVRGHRKLGVNYYLYADDLDAAVPTHDRNPAQGSYVVGFGKNVEADEEFANKSGNDLAKVNHRGICLPERLLLGAGLYVATGQHLDVVNRTLCAGSRGRDGDVPGVGFYPGSRKVCVDWYGPGNSLGYLRSRSVQFPLPA